MQSKEEPMPLSNSNLPYGLTRDELVRRLAGDIQEVFSTMVGVEDLLHLPIEIDPVTHFESCATAMVGLAGTYNGRVSLHATTDLARDVTSRMLGLEVAEFNDDVCDAVGEIANMIAGSFKQHLSSGGTDIRLSTPSVVTGKEHFVSSGDSSDTITLRFATDEDWFMVSVILEKE
jgi:chemotaxis protein CheX